MRAGVSGPPCSSCSTPCRRSFRLRAVNTSSSKACGGGFGPGQHREQRQAAVVLRVHGVGVEGARTVRLAALSTARRSSSRLVEDREAPEHEAFAASAWRSERPAKRSRLRRHQAQRHDAALLIRRPLHQRRGGAAAPAASRAGGAPVVRRAAAPRCRPPSARSRRRRPRLRRWRAGLASGDARPRLDLAGRTGCSCAALASACWRQLRGRRAARLARRPRPAARAAPAARARASPAASAARAPCARVSPGRLAAPGAPRRCALAWRGRRRSHQASTAMNSTPMMQQDPAQFGTSWPPPRAVRPPPGARLRPRPRSPGARRPARSW